MSDVGRDRDLERAAVANLVAHLAAMAAMALWLAPFLPGGGALDADRVARIAASPWGFRAGWLPWHLTAAVNAWFVVALLRTPWLPRARTVPAAALTALALVPDQGGQLWWVTRGVALAQEAVAAGDLGRYLEVEAVVFRHVAGTAAGLWTASWFAAARALDAAGVATPWSRRLEAAAWSLMLVASVAPWLPASVAPPAPAVAAVNAVGFLAFSAWLALACELLLRRRRPYAAWGRLARWEHPSRGPLARVVDAVANSRLLGEVLEPLPQFEMLSDISHVVYVNYLVEAARLEALVPEGLELQRVGPDGRYALFTFLTYRHGRFGWRFLGPLRALLLSPVQTNWRIHVRDPRTGTLGVYFLTNAVDLAPIALGARMTTEAMPMHVLPRAELEVRDGATRVRFDGAPGTGPDADLTLRDAPEPAMEGAWRACWPTWRDFLAYCVPQDRAMSSQPLRGRVTRQEIHLGIPLASCVPLEGEVRSRAAEALAGDARPLCFRVPGLRFRFEAERYDPLPPR